jgi:hypothetical protein
LSPECPKILGVFKNLWERRWYRYGTLTTLRLLLYWYRTVIYSNTPRYGTSIIPIPGPYLVNSVLFRLEIGIRSDYKIFGIAIHLSCLYGIKLLKF